MKLCGADSCRNPEAISSAPAAEWGTSGESPGIFTDYSLASGEDAATIALVRE